MMSLTSVEFFFFLMVTVFCYYLFKPVQKIVLLAASIFFYFSISSIDSVKLVIIMLFILLIAYFGAQFIEKAEGKVRSIILFLCIFAIVSALILLKYAYNLANVFCGMFSVSTDFSFLKFVSVAGISYYSLSTIGYLIDVYWSNQKPETNIADLALFIFYFPQLISGPITRYGDMRQQFGMKHNPDYSLFVTGLRRMAWGYFKKLVISERFGLVVSAVFGHYSDYGFFVIVSAVLCYAVQLYTDFSGCMDIVLGASNLFGIKLPENFCAPFYSETVQEFWRRWHITLGQWFKDYVMYPVQKSRFVINLGRSVKQKFGKKAGKKATLYVSMCALWFLLGLWHGGTGYYFIATGMIPFLILLVSDMCSEFFGKITKVLRINTECRSWHWFRRARTLLLICCGWLFICCGSTFGTMKVVEQMCHGIVSYTSFNSLISSFGLSFLDILLMVLGLSVLHYSDQCEYDGTNIFAENDKNNFVFRVIVIYTELLILLFYGMVGTSSFIYFQF